MRLRIGYEMKYAFPQPTPAILALNVHHTRVSDLEQPDHILTNPSTPISSYRDLFGNWCSRMLAPAGRVTITADTVIWDSGLPDSPLLDADQVAIENLPEEALAFLLASRFCDSDRLLDLAWSLFGDTPSGRQRVQAVCDFTHRHISFGYEHARPTRTASEGYEEGRGVCRDYAHLAVALCRALNIPARYCTGYISDIGTPEPKAPGDFAAWFEAYLGGEWLMFDPRNNTPRIGRVLIARGRDAADVAMITTFGANTLEGFRVWADEAGDLS